MKKIIVVFMLLLTVTTVFAQQFDVSGKVVDKKTNEPIIGASIMVKGTTIELYPI